MKAHSKLLRQKITQALGPSFSWADAWVAPVIAVFSVPPLVWFAHHWTVTHTDAPRYLLAASEFVSDRGSDPTLRAEHGGPSVGGTPRGAGKPYAGLLLDEASLEPARRAYRCCARHPLGLRCADHAQHRRRNVDVLPLSAAIASDGHKEEQFWAGFPLGGAAWGIHTHQRDGVRQPPPCPVGGAVDRLGATRSTLALSGRCSRV